MDRSMGLREIFWSGDEKAILAALADLSDGTIGDRQAPDLVSALMLRTDNRAIRNAASITLADIARTEAAQAIVEALRRPGVIGNSGTLLYALHEAGGKIPLSLAIDILEGGSAEAKEECLDLLEIGHYIDTDNATGRLAELAAKNSKFPEFSYALQYVLSRSGDRATHV